MIMKRSITQFSCLLALLAIATACSKDDDKAPSKPTISFDSESITVNEADGLVEIELTLTKALKEDVTIEFEISGTAQDLATETDDTDAADYGIDTEDYAEVELEAGETTVTIPIYLFSDAYYEED